MEEGGAQWLTRICPPAPAICRRPPTASSWAAGSFLSYFDGAVTRAQLAPEEGEEGTSDNVTFCQSAGNHATDAAGSSVAATEIDSNKCRERGRGREEGEDEGGRGREEEGQRGEKEG
ncbi:hypothetical protein NQZ68_026994 [Dissostichus eleginoides]|nr:hypothetical protein NQZ68_026994 [Dissostichus eleginoides]